MIYCILLRQVYVDDKNKFYLEVLKDDELELLILLEHVVEVNMIQVFNNF